MQTLVVKTAREIQTIEVNGMITKISFSVETNSQRVILLLATNFGQKFAWYSEKKPSITKISLKTIHAGYCMQCKPIWAGMSLIIMRCSYLTTPPQCSQSRSYTVKTRDFDE